MTLHKMVDGVKVFLTPEEETATLAEWAEYNRPRTAEELDTAITAEATREIGKHKLIKLIALVFFNHENRIRVLEGKAEIDMPTFKQALIDRYKLL